MRRIYANCLCLSITGKLRELWSFVFLCKAAKLTLTVSLSTPQEYRWVSDELSGKIDEMLGGNIAMDQYLIPGRGGGKGGRGTPSRFMLHKNQNSFFLPFLSHQRMIKGRKLK